MEEETMNQETPDRQGVMGADVAPPTTMELVVTPKEVSNNLQNLRDEELQVITQLNIPQFRDFMSKIFGQQFGTIMEQAIPEPQPQPQAQPQVSPQGENPSPMTGGGMMQPPSQ
tara:strand:+ start:460 stop:801 length:342 start_codon:yes stop_codon:yes gene_type:complete